MGQTPSDIAAFLAQEGREPTAFQPFHPLQFEAVHLADDSTGGALAVAGLEPSAIAAVTRNGARRSGAFATRMHIPESVPVRGHAATA